MISVYNTGNDRGENLMLLYVDRMRKTRTDMYSHAERDHRVIGRNEKEV